MTSHVNKTHLLNTLKSSSHGTLPAIAATRRWHQVRDDLTIISSVPCTVT
jgi:hypothetical protein